MRLAILLFSCVIVSRGEVVPSAWVAMGTGGSVRVTNDAAQTRSGRAALAFSYDLSKPQFAAAVLPAPAEIVKMQRLRFWARTDHDTSVAVLLGEKKPGGGNYSAIFWSPANVWQEIEFGVRDFEAGDGPNDPIDKDGKLDLDQVEGVAITDLAALFAGALSSSGAVTVDKASGPHTLLIDGFEILSSASEGSATPDQIDRFDRKFLAWMTPGGMKLTLAPDTNPLGERALKAVYEQTAGPFSVLIRRVGEPRLSNTKRVAFDIASENEATIFVVLEMKKPGSHSGPRYRLSIFPPAGRKIFHVELSLDDFEQEETAPQGPAHFDPAQWKSISFVDATAAAGGGAGGSNTIWIGNLRALRN